MNSMKHLTLLLFLSLVYLSVPWATRHHSPYGVLTGFHIVGSNPIGMVVAAGAIDAGRITLQPPPVEPPTHLGMTEDAAQKPTQDWVWPVKGKWRITAAYGEDRGYYRHTGVDIASQRGTAVVAVTDGIVVFAGTADAIDEGYGRYVDVAQKGGWVTRYAHLSRIDVRVGQKVEQAERLGIMGQTGNATGPHLHFEVRKERKTLEPMSFFPGKH